MKSLTLRRHPKNDQAADTTQLQPGEPGGEASESERSDIWGNTAVANALTKAITVALFVSLLAGPAAVAMLMLGAGSNSTVATPEGPSVADIDTQVAVSAFAEDFVTTWLTTPEGDETRLGAFISGASGITLPEQPWTVSDVATAGIRTTGDGLWSVTVAATVTAPTGDTQPYRRYFRVPVQATASDELVAQMLPSPVASPRTSEPYATDYRFRASPDDAVTDAAQQFLSALLAGQGEVGRYISPDIDIEAITPAPFGSIEVDDVRTDQDLTELGAPGTGQELHLLVTATATSALSTAGTAGKQATSEEPAAITVQYLLALTSRDGRWEISGLDESPVISDTDSPASSTTSTTNQ